MGNRLWMVLEQEVEDHYLVTETLKGLDGGLHCYRSVGGVLMESTVSDVQPAVRKELDALQCSLALHQKGTSAKWGHIPD